MAPKDVYAIPQLPSGPRCDHCGRPAVVVEWVTLLCGDCFLRRSAMRYLPVLPALIAAERS